MGDVTSTCCQNTTHLQQANLTRQINIEPVSEIQQLHLKQQPFQPAPVQIRQTIRQAFRSKYFKSINFQNKIIQQIQLDVNSTVWVQDNVITITRKRKLNKPHRAANGNSDQNISQRSSRSIFDMLTSEPTGQTYSTYIKPIIKSSNNSIKHRQNHETIDQTSSLSGIFLIYFPNKQYFLGELIQNSPVNGIFIFKSNCYYVGNIKNLHAQGQGKYENKSNGYIYEGFWSKNLQHGKGKQFYSQNGDVFEGQFMYGSKFGEGTHISKNGSKYQGYFYNGLCDGHGKYSLNKKEWYSGQWKLGTIQGKGQYHYPNGDIYYGEFQSGKRNGNGRYVFASGYQYDGSWLNGKMHGRGIIRQGYDQIQGEWLQGSKVA